MADDGMRRWVMKKVKQKRGWILILDNLCEGKFGGDWKLEVKWVIKLYLKSLWNKVKMNHELPVHITVTITSYVCLEEIANNNDWPVIFELKWLII